MGRSSGLIRTLAAGERALARGVFDDAINLDRVRVLTPPWPWWPLTRAFVPGRWFGRDWIVWPRRRAANDLSAGPFGAQAVLVHELVHVWQAQQGVNLLVGKIRAGDSRASYVYPTTSCDWGALNIEQQAMVVEHAFRLSRGRTAPASAAFYRATAPFTCGLDPV